MQEEVVNNYLLWELSKPYIRSLMTQPSDPLSKIEQITQNIRSNIESDTLVFNEKLNLVKFFSPHSNRVNLLANCSWTKKNYLIRDLGTVLPVCGDLPLDIITRSLSDVIEYVKKRLNEPNQEKSVGYITDLVKIPNVLTMFPPIVVEPGSLQRNIRVMEMYHGPGKWSVQPTLGYIEDGNHRAIAMAIVRNLESIPCYVGNVLFSHLSCLAESSTRM